MTRRERIVFRLANHHDFATFRRVLRDKAEEAVVAAGFGGEVFVQVAGGVMDRCGGSLTIRAFPVVDGIPRTEERDLFMLAKDLLVSRHGIGVEVLGGGVRGSKGGDVMGWIAGLSDEGGGNYVVVVEENTTTRDWVGVPIPEIVEKIERFGLEPATSRRGGRIA